MDSSLVFSTIFTNFSYEIILNIVSLSLFSRSWQYIYKLLKLQWCILALAREIDKVHYTDILEH